ncbi:hypothetical protein CASFOL_030384 [Castilleja foliolosa]|uniref:Uncharacterized protein n=1 Tax=Castilleja foliolosa TaxID=1961234 RepID=A0ABD3CAP8_9LAMI
MKTLAPINNFQLSYLGSDFVIEDNNFKEICVPTNGPSPVDESSNEGENSKVTDTATFIQFISELLMDEEDDFDNNPCMLHDSLALQVLELCP